MNYISLWVPQAVPYLKGTPYFKVREKDTCEFAWSTRIRRPIVSRCMRSNGVTGCMERNYLKVHTGRSVTYGYNFGGGIRAHK